MNVILLILYVIAKNPIFGGLYSVPLCGVGNTFDLSPMNGTPKFKIILI